ncbi:SET domain-containing protein [Planktothrix sp. FACHB-1355]|uniref:SET domain-containing protein n=1 Tax=Aerosakkonema funiforme FACHB-1375 TaxID=2949571 RepID=A0A926VM76_9CYAN|nr:MULTISPECIES: SET domain-containing protein [Oscillatoriales]MBD2186360.1 SET domain-containing protein [Aerosakkonema funiforme FACHB-1375]MBD3562411.1 SET domain-containing protein [Planktothrix sp. FACHB-1355]
MIHPHTELRYINKIIGYGVFATKLIPKGTITWVLDELDQRFSPSYILSLNPILREKLLKYCYRDNEGTYILCWDIGKFVNHSFNSSCIGTAYKFELAVRDIHPGEELTDDYGYLNLDKPFYCFPEKGSPRTKVMPDDILQYYPEWDKKAVEAMNYFNQVQQPLKGLINHKYLDKVNAVAEGKEEMDSILNVYYERSKKLKFVS